MSDEGELQVILRQHVFGKLQLVDRLDFRFPRPLPTGEHPATLIQHPLLHAVGRVLFGREPPMRLIDDPPEVADHFRKAELSVHALDDQSRHHTVFESPRFRALDGRSMSDGGTSGTGEREQSKEANGLESLHGAVTMQSRRQPTSPSGARRRAPSPKGSGYSVTACECTRAKANGRLGERPLAQIAKIASTRSMREQKPIGSGFVPKTPALDVIAGTDLSGKVAVVTGGYSGIGVETVRALTQAGAKVYVPARRPEAAKEAMASFDGTVEIATMDLGDIASVRRFASDFDATGQALHLLINNAGIMACPQTRIGPGWEQQFGVNHLGHMALTQGLLPALRRANGARVVALSSIAHARSDILWDDIHFTTNTYDKWTAYAQSKTANALFALGLDMREEAAGIRAFSVHPGGIFTPLQRHLPDEEMVALGWKNADGSLPEAVKAIFKSPEEGASTTIWAATSEKLSGTGGLYCEDCDVALLATPESPRFFHVRQWACDPQAAERLWTLSEQMLADA